MDEAVTAEDAEEEARYAEEEASYEATWHMICVLEGRDLTTDDIRSDLLHLAPPEPLEYKEHGLPFFASDVNDPPCTRSTVCATLGDCLLRRAAALGRSDSAVLLIRLGASLDFAMPVLEFDGCRGTPLVNACEAGHTDMVRLLIESGAQVNAWACCCEFESVDECFFAVRMEWTALHAACAWGNLEVVQLLLEQRAEVDTLCRYP